jgi:carotenoid cleavage dioxygenase-like enzyme
MTDSYFVLIEQPFVISIPHVLYEHRIVKGVSSNVWKWNEDQETRFYIVNRKNNQVLRTKFFSKPFFFFHMINTYEESGHLIVDVITYDNADLLEGFFTESIRDSACDSAHAARLAKAYKCRPQRFVIPLLDIEPCDDYPASKILFNGVMYKESDDMVQLDYSGARAILEKDRIHLMPESLAPAGEATGEMPTINYHSYNGKKYRYFYGLKKKGPTVGLMKCDTLNKSVKSWHETGCYASEPIFVPRPAADSTAFLATRSNRRHMVLPDGGSRNNHDSEDDGVLLSLVISESDERKGFLLVLDGKSMKEVARAEFASPSILTPTFHGIFLPLD